MDAVPVGSGVGPKPVDDHLMGMPGAAHARDDGVSAAARPPGKQATGTPTKLVEYHVSLYTRHAQKGLHRRLDLRRSTCIDSALLNAAQTQNRHHSDASKS
jgi:hypothetical protein